MAVFPNLNNARIAVERLMAETCVIERDSQSDEDLPLDPLTGEIVEPAPTEIYSGKTKVKYSGSATREEGGRTVVVQSFAGAIPIGSPEIRPGDWYAITTAGRDQTLVGLRARITEVERSTMAVQRRFTAEAVLEPSAEERP